MSSSGAQTQSCHSMAGLPSPAALPSTSRKRSTSELDSEAPDLSDEQPPRRQKKLKKRHVLAFVNEDASDEEEIPQSLGDVPAEDGTPIKQESAEGPILITQQASHCDNLREKVARKLDTMRETKFRILTGIQCLVLDYKAASAALENLDGELLSARRKLDSFDRLIEEVQGLDGALRRPVISRLFRQRRVGAENVAVLWKAEAEAVLGQMGVVRERRWQAWAGCYRRVKAQRRELERVCVVLDQRWAVFDDWVAKMEEFEGLEEILQSPTIASFLA